MIYLLGGRPTRMHFVTHVFFLYSDTNGAGCVFYSFLGCIFVTQFIGFGYMARLATLERKSALRRIIIPAGCFPKRYLLLCAPV